MSQADPDERKNRIKKHPLEWAIAILLLFTLIATSIAACYTKKQWETAVDNEHKSLRAYVSLRGIRLERRNDNTFDIIPEWENSGESQTINMRAYENGIATNLPIPDNIAYGNYSTIVTVPIVLGPKTISNISFSQVDKVCLDQFNRRDELTRYLIWGHAEYDDVFSIAQADKKEHITRFCLDINQFIFSPDGKSARLSYGLCKEGNCMDSECPTPERATFTMPVTFCKSEPSPAPGTK
jgi:hypothetical protein